MLTISALREASFRTPRTDFVAARKRRKEGKWRRAVDDDDEATSAAQVTKPDPGARMRVRAGGRAPKKCPRIIESSGTRSVRISFVNRNQFFSAGRRRPSENGAGPINFRLPRLFAERPTHSRNRNSPNRSTIEPKLDGSLIRLSNLCPILSYILYLYMEH